MSTTSTPHATDQFYNVFVLPKVEAFGHDMAVS